MTIATPANPDQQRRVILIFFLALVPLLLFVLLRLNTDIDPLWEYPVFHFYIVSFASLTALVVAVFVLGGIGIAGSQAIFTAIAFIGMSGIFLLHGAATPNVLMPVGHGIGLSGRLSLTVGAVFLGLAVSDFKPILEQRIIQYRRVIWGVLMMLYIGYLLFIVNATHLVSELERIPALNTGLAILTIGILLLATWRAWHKYQIAQNRVTLTLALALPWLIIAQISQWQGPLWRGSWWLYHVLMLAAYMITMGALVTEYEQVRNFRVTRYFTALSIIVGVPLMVLLSEAAVQISGIETLRWPMFGLSFLAILALFIALLIIVRRAESILKERTTALEIEKKWRVDFTNLLVHDLKSPLSVISVSVNLMLSGKVDNEPDKQRVLLDRARRGSTEALEMVENLLGIERLEAGALKLARTPTNFNALIRESTEAISGLAEFYELQLGTNLPEALPTLSVDEVLIRRVLQNLLTNALKFTPKGGHIRVEAQNTPQQVSISIIDSGPGVVPEQRQRIFEKFVQADGNSQSGSGLGLAFCKLAVEAHGGRIWVDDAPGQQGSRFTFTLPNN